MMPTSVEESGKPLLCMLLCLYLFLDCYINIFIPVNTCGLLINVLIKSALCCKVKQHIKCIITNVHL